mgnify:CR=1 FL=1
MWDVNIFIFEILQQQLFYSCSLTMWDVNKNLEEEHIKTIKVVL